VVTVTPAFADGHAVNSRVEQLSSPIKYDALRLIHPNQLRAQAYQVLSSTLVPGSLNNDASALWPDYRDKKLVPLSVHSMFLGSITRWGMIAGKKALKVCFVGGQEEPQMLLRDNPIVNGMFEGDYFTWRARLEWARLMTGHLCTQISAP
jgi:hypothetical protein